jgi:hypothetical protein
MPVMEHRYHPTSINHELVLMGQILDDVDDVHNGFGGSLWFHCPTLAPTINPDDDNVAIAEGEAPLDGSAAATASTTTITCKKRKCTSNV